MRQNHIQFILFLIILVAVSARLYNLTAESLWVDEGYSVNIADLSTSKIISETAKRDVNPPLFYLILSQWVIAFGNSELSVRLLPAIFGILGVIVAYFVGKFFDKEVGMIAAALLAISTFHIAYSQDVRMYSMIALLALVSYYFYFRLLSKKDSWIWVAYVISTILLMYSHMYAIFIVLAQNISFLLIASKKNISFDAIISFTKRSTPVQTPIQSDPFKESLTIKEWAVTQLVIWGFFSLWIMIAFNKLFSFGEDFWIGPSSLFTILETLGAFSGSPLSLVILSACTLLCFMPPKKGVVTSTRQNYPLHLVSLWLFMPLILPIILSLLFFPLYVHRYTILALPSLFLLVGVGISRIQKRIWKYAIIAVIAILMIQSTYAYYSHPAKEQWRDAVSYIEENANNSDLLLFHPGFVYRYAYTYYQTRNLSIVEFPKQGLSLDETYLPELTNAVRGKDRVWLILSHSRDKQNIIRTYLSQSYTSTITKKFIGIDVELFEKKL